MTAPEPADFTWVYDTDAGEGACLTLVTGASREDVLAAFGADPTAPVPLLADTEPEGLVSVVDVEGGLLAVEVNGYLGSMPELVTRLSARGRCASIFWNVEHDNALTCAEAGRLVVEVEMYSAEDPDDVELPDELWPAFRALGPFIAADDHLPDHPGIWATGLAMAALFTGIRPTASDVDGRSTAYRVPE